MGRRDSVVRAAVLREQGRTRPYSSSRPLTIEELELEDARGTEVEVRVMSAGICHSDLSAISGVRQPPLPLVLGHECAGIVETVGDQVTRVKEGDHVVLSYVPVCGKCYFCLSGRPSLCDPGRASNKMGTLMDGNRRFKKDGKYLNHHLGVSAFSDHTVVVENSVVKIREDLPINKAALFGCAVLTGIGAVNNTARVRIGDSVAVFGCGGVGLNIVQGAALAGARQIIAVDLVPQKLELARQFGATDTVDASQSDPVEEIRRLTSGLGVEHSFEAIGSTKVVEQAYRSARKGGKTIAVGITAPNARLDLPSSILVDEERTLVGSFMGSSVPQRDIPALIDLYLGGRLKLDELVSGYVGIDGVNDAFESLASGVVARQILNF